MIQSLNPATGILLRSFDPLTPEALAARLALASAAAKTFPRESLDQRIFWMRRLATLLDADIEELAALMTSEMGKTLAAGRQEVLKCAAVCRYYADNAVHILASDPIPTEHADSYIRYDPLGVILAVMPWNFPLWQVFRFAAPALMAGNVGLLKHASNVPQCALAIEALIRRAGFPRGTFQTLLIEARQVETLLADDRVAAVTVTGSEAAGRAIAAQAGWLIKKSVLELGGSDPFLVMASADLDLAVPNAVKARCINNGQSCIAAKRFLIHDSIYDEFERRFTEAMAALRVGDPSLPSTEIGPIATPQLLDELLTQVSIARAAGAKVLTGGGRAKVDDRHNGNGLSATNGNLHATGNYFQPTVIANISRLSPLCKAEIFGPVALLFRVTGLDDAIALANDTPFGLAASAWTNDPLEQHRLSSELQCGAVFFNQVVASDPRLPFGGIKRSGYGRELSYAGMREFLNAKTIVVGQTAATLYAAQGAARLHQAPRTEASDLPRVPTEFSNFADQIRKWEPRKPSPLDRESALYPADEPRLQPRRSASDPPDREPLTPSHLTSARPEPARLQPEPVAHQTERFQLKPDPAPPAPAPRRLDADPDADPDAEPAPELARLQPELAQLPPAPARPEPVQPELTQPEPAQLQPAPTQLEPPLAQLPTSPEPVKPHPERRPPNGLRPIVFDSVPDPVKLAPIVWDVKPEERKLAPIVWDSKPDERKLAPIVWDSDDRDRRPAPVQYDRAPEPARESNREPSRRAQLVLEPEDAPAPRKLPRLIYGDETPENNRSRNSDHSHDSGDSNDSNDSNDRPPTRGSILGL